MLKELSQELFGYLTDQTEFVSVMDNRIFPLAANQATEFPLTTYRISELRGVTKDIVGGSFQLFFWFNNDQYDACVDFTDAMTALLKTKYRFVSSTVDLSEDTMFFNGIINLEKY